MHLKCGWRAWRPLAPSALAAVAALCACAQMPPRALGADAEALADAMARRPIVLLGEVHDNVAQHALRLQAVRLLLERGLRPAFAFEQLDRDDQEKLDRARAQDDGDAAVRADRLIEAAGGRGWDWKLYRPYLVVALQNDLPIVAANLSRAQAMRVAQEGVGAVFDAAQRTALGLDAIAPDIMRAQARAIEDGHCGRVPPGALEAMATAQVARDAMLAQAITPYLDRGVILFTGNGHARRDIGVARHLPPADRTRVISIGLLEDEDDSSLREPGAADRAASFDVAFMTRTQPRPDPCASIPRMRVMTDPAAVGS